jgi:F-type H+-transporting ATPase subunit b
MNLNATLFLQSIAMMIFVWFCMKFIWPVLLRAMDERREKIAEGLAASDRAEKELQSAKAVAGEEIRQAREKAGEIVEQANQRHGQILEQAKEDAVAERNRQVTAAEAEIALAANQAREALRSQVASLAVLGASRLLEKEVDADVHRKLLDQLIAEI